MRSSARAFLPVVLLAAGCGGGEASRTEEVPANLREVTRVVPSVPDRHPYADVSLAKPGQWVKVQEGERTLTIAAVVREGGDVWIEVIEEGEVRDASARLVSPGGTVKKALFREITKDGPSQVVPQPLEQMPAPPAPGLAGARETADEKVKVGEREIAAKRVRTRSESLDGRIVEETSWWSPDVPALYASSPDGGLVRRVTSKRTVQLLDFGGDAKPLVAPSGN